MSYSNSIRRIRVLATLIIVLYHCFCPFLSHGGWNMYDNTTIESFGHWLCNIVLADKMLPTFFIMSGMLYFSSRKHKVEKKVLLILNKFDRLLVPYALFMTLYFAVIEPLTGPNSSPGHLWFLTILFSCFTIAIFLRKVDTRILIVFSFPLMFFASRLGDVNLLIFDVSKIVSYMFWFFAGWIVSNYYEQIKNMNRLLLRISILLWITCVCFEFPFKQTLLYIMFNLLLFHFISDKPFTNTVFSRVILALDKCSFAIYLIHHFIIVLLLRNSLVSQLYIMYPIISVVGLFWVALMMSYGIAIFFHKMEFKWF